MYNTETTDTVFSGAQCDTLSHYLCNSHNQVVVRKGCEVSALSINFCFPVQKENIFINFCPLSNESVLLLRIREDKKKHSTEKD